MAKAFVAQVLAGEVGRPTADAASRRPAADGIEERAAAEAQWAAQAATAATDADAETWRNLMNQPVVASADAVTVDDLYLVSNDMTDALNLSAHPGAATADPYALVADDLKGLNQSIRSILGVDHPVLSRVAQYFFSMEGGKKMRPAMVLLMSQAVNAHMAAALAPHLAATAVAAADPAAVATPPPSPPLLRLNSAPVAPQPGVAGPESALVVLPPHVVLPLQHRLAEITEMIHTASLLHDDVVDNADTRRGVQSVNSMFGNKLAVLAGDFLLARASVCLSRLRNIPVVELLSTVIEHLVKGEVLQMKGAGRSDAASRIAMDMYLRKTYYKTGSLMANSCKAIALLGGYPAAVADAAFRYGMHVGVAFQLVDDMLDYQGTTASLGKPSMADMRLGLATAPVLFAAQRYPVLLPIIERKFDAPGDIETALKCVAAADGLTATRRLAVAHGQMAVDALSTLRPSAARTALASLVTRVLSRDH